MKLEMKYVELLKQAESTNNRKDAIKLINEADRIRAELCRQQPEHPLCYG